MESSRYDRYDMYDRYDRYDRYYRYDRCDRYDRYDRYDASLVIAWDRLGSLGIRWLGGDGMGYCLLWGWNGVGICVW